MISSIIFMKKRSGINRVVAHATITDLQKMSTKALLARLAHLRMCEESLAVSDLLPSEAQSVNGILFKATPEWSEAFAQVREELGNREHIPRPKGRSRSQ
jgi:hypothetical protein